jgi:hypothetical protein
MKPLTEAEAIAIRAILSSSPRLAMKQMPFWWRAIAAILDAVRGEAYRDGRNWTRDLARKEGRLA